jgi:SAM-dependent methyltransferase
MRARVPDYGLDAPAVVGRLGLFGLAGLVAGLLGRFVLGEAAFDWVLWSGLSCLVSAAGMVLSSRVGKLWVRNRLLGSIPWTGTGRVLDVGCGRGLLLVGAARRLENGLAVGVDIWRARDQAGNYPGAVLLNAAAEGVADRVAVVTGDARALPFADGAFDVVVTGLVLHNIDRRGQEAALAELVRVLRPGGYVAIFDIVRGPGYARALRAHGVRVLKLSGPWPLFWLPAWLVIGQKLRTD